MINVYVDDIKKSLKNKCYFSALALSLALPDICGMVEFPEEHVSDRYMHWFDKYVTVQNDVGNSPYLSGEMVYNLRNTYLHQGSPSVVSEKVKEERNRLDKFVLNLGDGKLVWSLGFCFSVGDVAVRNIMVDVTYLCEIICDTAKWYYEQNKEKFVFDGNFICQECMEIDQNKESAELLDDAGAILGYVLEEKLEKQTGRRFQIADDVKKSFRQMISDISDSFKKWRKEDQSQESKKKTKPRITKSKRELQVRMFFEKNFKEQKYKANKEIIIQAVLHAKTKTQLNVMLTKKLPGNEVKEVIKRLKPLVKNLPGK